MKPATFAAVAALTLIATTTPAYAQPPKGIPMMPPIALTDPGTEGVRVNEAGVFGNYFPAASNQGGRHGAVLLLGGSEGGLGLGATRMARALAAHGFNVLQISYFGGPEQPAALVNVPLETFSKGLAWLRARPDVIPDRIALVGGSKGGEAVLLIASREVGIRAVVSGMPSSVSWPGISYTAGMQPGWSVGGVGVPFVPYAFGTDYRNIYGAYEGGLKTLPQHRDAIIPVERITGAVMLVCGKDDSLWPSCPMAEQVASRLKDKGFAHPVQLLEYANAGHAVFGPPVDPANPNFASLGNLGGTPDGNNTARKDDWPRTLAFLDEALK